MTALGAYGDFRERILQADSARVLDRIADHVHASALPGPQRTELYDLITERRKAFPADSPTPKGDAQNPPPFSAPRPTSSPSPGTAGRPEDSDMEEDAELQRKMAGTREVDAQWPPAEAEMDKGVSAAKDKLPDPKLDKELALIPQTAIDTPEKMKWAADMAMAQYDQFERVKAHVLREGRDYVYICKVHRADRDHPYKTGLHGFAPPLCAQGSVHIKAPAADKLASLFSVSVRLDAKDLVYDEGGKLVLARYTHTAEWNGRKATKVGVCEMSELYEKTVHNCETKAESRSRRRAILAVLGSADPEAEGADEEE